MSYIFEEMNTEALEAGYTPDNRYRYIRPTELAPIIPGSYIVHQFYLVGPEVSNLDTIKAITVQYAYGLQKLFVKQYIKPEPSEESSITPLLAEEGEEVGSVSVVQLKDACEVIVQLSTDETEEFLRKFPEIDVYKEPYLSAHCQLIVTKTDGKVIYSEIQNIKVKLPLNKYINERVYEDDNA